MNIIRTLYNFRINVKQNSVFNFRFKHEIAVDESNFVTLAHIKRKIKAWFSSSDDGFTCLSATCPMCPANAKCDKSIFVSKKIFINKTSGFYICGCNKYAGNWDQFEKYMDSKKTVKTIKGLSSLKESVAAIDRPNLNAFDSITKHLLDISTLSDNEFTDIFQPITITVKEKPILEHLEARIDSPHKKLYLPLRNISTEIIGYKVIRLKNGTEQVIPNDCNGILVYKPQISSTSAILLKNALDLINLAQFTSNCDLICLANGTTILPQEILPFLEQYQKISIWFNNDVHSWNAATHFAKKLKEDRCMVVKTNENFIAPTSIKNITEFKRILSNVTPIWHKSITTFASLREDVLYDLKNIEKIQGIKWTRYHTLNRILKGHRRGELTVLTGPTGSGKTTFISEYSLDLAMQGVNTLWGSFEIRNARLARTMLQQMSGIPMESNLDKFEYWADQFEMLPIYFMTFHGQQSVKVVMEAVEHAAYVHDIAHVIIDNVQFMMGMSDDTKHIDRFWKQDIIVAAFRTFATKKNCHVTLVIHPRKEREADDLTTSSIFGGAKAAQEADNVLLIQDKRLTSIRGKKYLQVAKNRYSGDLGIMPLDFDKSGLSYRQKKKSIEKAKVDEGEVVL